MDEISEEDYAWLIELGREMLEHQTHKAPSAAIDTYWCPEAGEHFLALIGVMRCIHCRQRLERK